MTGRGVVSEMEGRPGEEDAWGVSELLVWGVFEYLLWCVLWALGRGCF